MKYNEIQWNLPESARICKHPPKPFPRVENWKRLEIYWNFQTCLTWSALAGSNAVAETSQCVLVSLATNRFPQYSHWGTRTPGKYGGGLSLLGGGPKRGTSVVSWSRTTNERQGSGRNQAVMADVWSEGRHLHHGENHNWRCFLLFLVGWKWLGKFCSVPAHFFVEKAYKSSACLYCDVVPRLSLPVQKRRKRPHAKMNPEWIHWYVHIISQRECQGQSPLPCCQIRHSNSRGYRPISGDSTVTRRAENICGHIPISLSENVTPKCNAKLGHLKSWKALFISSLPFDPILRWFSESGFKNQSGFKVFAFGKAWTPWTLWNGPWNCWV